MEPYEYATYDALGLKALIDAGEISATELHQIAFNAIETLNPKLNFFTSASPEEANRALSHFNRQAPFSGIPFLLKDGGMVGQPIAMASRLAGDFRCKEDSELIRRLKCTGVVIMGGTNTPEFGTSTTTEPLLHGPARNPWNIDYSTGGSSGGASAAVAAGVVPMAQSSDGGGSIRIPAHCCGVFGLMPTRGRNPVGPNSYGGIFGFVRYHVTTRSVRDSAAMLDRLHGPEPGALHRVAPPQRPFLEAVGTEPRRLRIAFSTTSTSGRIVHPDCVAAVEKAAKLCEDLGHDVEEDAPVYDWELFFRAFMDNCNFMTMGAIEKLKQLTGREAGPETLEQCNLAIINSARSLSPSDFSASIMQLHTINRNVEQFFDNWDVLITPVCLSSAPPLGKINSNKKGLTADGWGHQVLSEFAAFTSIFNAGGQPSMSVPLHQSTEGLPIGVQCTARAGDEATLFRLAAQFEQACPWIDRRPQVGLYSTKDNIQP